MIGWLFILLVLVYQGRAATTTGPLSFTTLSEEVTSEEEPNGTKKFGDKCESTRECGFSGAICNESPGLPVKSCQCRSELPATNQVDKCGPMVEINGSCFFTEQCAWIRHSDCRNGRCICLHEMVPMINNNKMECIVINKPPESLQYVDPAMIGVLVGMALMFIIICVVLRLFSKARWRENRTIFNTPNPRLMNVSLLRESKPPGERRGSKGSNTRMPSRQPSLASLRPQSPAGQSQGSRISSRGSLKGSHSSSGSARSPTAHHTHPSPQHQSNPPDVQKQPNSVA